MDKVPAASLASSDAFLKRHPIQCLKLESQTEMSSSRTIKATSTRLFLEIETPVQKSDRNSTTQQPADGSPTGQHAKTKQRWNRRTVKAGLGQSYPGGDSLGWRYCFLELTGHVAGRPVTAPRDHFSMKTLKGGGLLQPYLSRAPQTTTLPLTSVRQMLPNNSKLISFTLGRVKINISKLVLGELKWPGLHLPPM